MSLGYICKPLEEKTTDTWDVETLVKLGVVRSSRTQKTIKLHK